MGKFYVTSSIVYTNAAPHIGYAMELIQADVLARYHRQKGEDVWFLTGTDEHGTKIKRTAEKAGKQPQVYVDEMSQVYKDLTAKLSLEQNVTFTGVVSNEDKGALYQNADVFVIASPAELQSIVTLEAMSCGLPIVVVAAGALIELCVSGSNGLLCKAGDSLDLANQLNTLIESEQLRTSYGAASRRLVETSHSLHATILAYEAAYTGITGVSAAAVASSSEPTTTISGKI